MKPSSQNLLKLEEAEKRIAELESEREQWRVSSVCREKQARIEELERALERCKEEAGTAFAFDNVCDIVNEALSDHFRDVTKMVAEGKEGS